MKAYLVFALAGVLASSATLLAIPDRVGTFLTGTNSRVEDFALSLDTWSVETFSADWEDKSVEDTDEDVYQLKRAFVVFGVEAEKVSAIKRNGNLDRFLVTYRPDDKKNTSTGKIVKTLRRNIETYTGEDFADAAANGKTAAGLTCKYKEFEIYLGERQKDHVLVAIRRVATST